MCSVYVGPRESDCVISNSNQDTTDGSGAPVTNYTEQLDGTRTFLGKLRLIVTLVWRDL